MNMTDTQQYGALVGMILPAVMAVIVQTHWSATLKSWVAFIACVVAAGLVAVFTGQIDVHHLSSLDATTLGTTVALVTGIAWSLYHGFYKPTGIAPAIERVTNLPHVTVSVQHADPVPATPAPVAPADPAPGTVPPTKPAA